MCQYKFKSPFVFLLYWLLLAFYIRKEIYCYLIIVIKILRYNKLFGKYNISDQKIK